MCEVLYEKYYKEEKHGIFLTSFLSLSFFVFFVFVKNASNMFRLILLYMLKLLLGMFKVSYQKIWCSLACYLKCSINVYRLFVFVWVYIYYIFSNFLLLNGSIAYVFCLKLLTSLTLPLEWRVENINVIKRQQFMKSRSTIYLFWFKALSSTHITSPNKKSFWETVQLAV